VAIPIIFIHYGNSDCLFYAVWQAKQTNPGSRIILLGDRQNVHLQWLLGIEHYFIKAYEKEAKQALEHYIHLSTNGEEFERFCLERWFVLHSFLSSNTDLQPCVYLDSDILVYDSLDLPAKDLQSFGMTMVAFSAHTNFVNRQQTLGEFCQFIQSHYQDPSLQSWLHQHHIKFLQKHGAGGISDMTFFQKFRQQYPEKLGTLCFPMGNQNNLYAFDERLDTDDGGYELKNGIKSLTWIDRFPYCKNTLCGQKIKMYTLHFQGKNKLKMKDYLKNITYSFHWQGAVSQFFVFTGKARNKAKRYFKILD